MIMTNKTINRILIVGGSGFIGQHLIKELKKKKFKIYIPKKKELNLRNKKLIIKYLNEVKPNIIVNLASSTKFFKDKIKDKNNHHNNTFMSAINLAKCIDCKITKLAIFFGSIEEYGNCKFAKKENSKFKPSSIYGKNKRKACLEAVRNFKRRNINYLWLRPSLVYGDNDNNDRYIGYIVEKIKKNKKIIIKPGKQVRDYLFIDDLIKITVFFIKNFKTKFNFSLNISSKNFVNLDQIPNKISKLIKKPIKFTILKNTKCSNKMQNNTRLLKVLPKFNFTNFDDGLKKTLIREKIID